MRLVFTTIIGMAMGSFYSECACVCVRVRKACERKRSCVTFNMKRCRCAKEGITQFSIGIGRRMWVGGPGLGIRLMAKPGPRDINIILKVTKKRSPLIYSNKTFSPIHQ